MRAKASTSPGDWVKLPRMFGLAAKRAPAGTAPPQTLRHGAAAELRQASFAYSQIAGGGGRDAVGLYSSDRRFVFALADIGGARATGEPLARELTRTFDQDSARLFRAAEFNEAEALSNLAMTLNRALMMEGRVRCAAAFLGCFDAQTGALWYVNAGHAPAVVQDAAQAELQATGVPFGLFSHAIHDAQVTVLKPGSAFLLLSKGLADAQERGQKLALRGAKAIMAKAHGRNASQLCAAVLDSAEASPDPRPARQRDCTVVALVRA